MPAIRPLPPPSIRQPRGARGPTVRRLGVLVAAGALALAAAAAASGRQPGNAYHQTNLVSDLPGVARSPIPTWSTPGAWPPARRRRRGWPTTAPTRPPSTPGSSTAAPSRRPPLVVNIPGGAPTGQVFNPPPGSWSTPAQRSGPAQFIFDSEAGLITGWSPGVPAAAVDRRRRSVPARHAIYKGLAIATTPDRHLPVRRRLPPRARSTSSTRASTRCTLSGGFADPNLPAGFAPFNIQELGGRLYVAYAKQDADAEDDVAGPGLGFVDVFSTSGHLLRRLISHGPAERAVGPGAGAGQGSAASAATCWSATSATAASTPTTRHGQLPRAADDTRTATRSDRRAVGAAVRQRRHRHPDHPAVHRRHRRRGPRPVRRDRRPRERRVTPGHPAAGNSVVPATRRPVAPEDRRVRRKAGRV